METTLNPLGAGYPVSLPIFDGPIELLLHLIERQELDITEVSLVAITDQYLRAIEAMQEVEPEALADFLVVAARLLYIKSRGLLPQPVVEEEEEEKQSEALIQQLLDYRRFKAAAGELRLRASIGLRTNARLAPPQMERRLDLTDLTIERLAAAAQRRNAQRRQQPGSADCASLPNHSCRADLRHPGTNQKPSRRRWRRRHLSALLGASVAEPQPTGGRRHVPGSSGADQATGNCGRTARNFRRDCPAQRAIRGKMGRTGGAG